MLNLLEDIQKQLDAGHYCQIQRAKKPDGRALPNGLYLFASEHTRGPRFALNRAGGGGACQRRMLFKNLVWTSEFCGNSFVRVY